MVSSRLLDMYHIYCRSFVDQDFSIHESFLLGKKLNRFEGALGYEIRWFYREMAVVNHCLTYGTCFRNPM